MSRRMEYRPRATNCAYCGGPVVTITFENRAPEDQCQRPGCKTNDTSYLARLKP